jgi:hypothetical protein
MTLVPNRETDADFESSAEIKESSYSTSNVVKKGHDCGVLKLARCKKP